MNDGTNPCGSSAYNDCHASSISVARPDAEQRPEETSCGVDGNDCTLDAGVLYFFLPVSIDCIDRGERGDPGGKFQKTIGDGLILYVKSKR